MAATLDYVAVTEFGLERTAEILARGFADYLVKIPASPAMLLQLVRGDSVDLAASRVVCRDGVGVGVALIARRGWTCRLAGMALVPEARRSGVGRALVTRLLDEAKGRGERTMVLEVIEQNEPAVRLYEALGFARVRRLVGFSLAAPVATAAGKIGSDVVEVDVREVAAAVTAWAPANLPWQLSGETLAQAGPPTRAYRRGVAWLVCTDPAAAQVTVRALGPVGGKARDGAAAGLLRDVAAAHGGREWRVSAIWPEEWRGVFEAAGFARGALSQWQMERRC
jgi:ribosomal protein S18 acetylase RimI-like enzyme